MLIYARRRGCLRSLVFASFLLGSACALPLAEQPVAAPILGEVRDAAAAQRFVLIGSGPFYALQLASDGVSLRWLASVRLASRGRDLSSFLRTDGRTTGEPAYTLISEPLALGDLDSPRYADAGANPALSAAPKQRGFSAKLRRGTKPSAAAALKRFVDVEVMHLFTTSAMLTAAARGECPVFIFGSQRELFAFGDLSANGIGSPPRSPWSATGRPETEVRLAQVRVRAGVFSPAQAAQIASGVCLQPGAGTSTQQQTLDILAPVPLKEEKSWSSWPRPD